MTQTVQQPVKHDYERIPYLVAYQNNSGVRDVYGGVAELVVLESYLLKPKDKPSDTVLVFMHPIGGGAYLPMINALARAGHHVIYCNSRFRGTDSALLMEKVVEDLGECIKDAKNRLGYCQGGAGRLERRRLAVGVLPAAGAAPDGHREPVRRRPRPDQAGADPRRRHHAAGRAHQPARHHDRVDGRVDPRRVRPHQARSRSSISTTRTTRTSRPTRRSSWSATAQAQIARNRRITKWVKEKLAELKAAGRPDDEFAFVVHGTMADPRWLDPTVDPNDRTPGTCYLGDPQVVNMSPVGLARFCTLRSWLSQWSYDDANGDAVKAGPDIAVPALVIGNLADDACTPEPHPAAVRGDRSSRQGDARDPRRQPLLRRPGPARHPAPGRRHLHRLAAPARALASDDSAPARWTGSGSSRSAP